MATTHEQWLTIGKVFSVLGALTIFGPWLTIDYYDHYGAIYESYNGFTLFDSGYFFGIAMFIPIVVAALFVASFIKFKAYGNQKIGSSLLLIFVTIFILSWWFNYSVMGVYDNYPYFTEKYDSGLAEIGAVVIALLNVIFAYHADKRLSKSNPPIKPDYNAVNPPQTENNNYCPGCGAYIASETNKGASFCPYCGKDLSTKTKLIYDQFEK